MSDTSEVDDHARRMVQGFLVAIDEFKSGQRTLLDLSATARSTADTLDNASAPLPRLLEEASNDMEYAYFASESKEHVEAARRALAPFLAHLANDD